MCSSDLELSSHNCLTFGLSGSQSRGWLFLIDGVVSASKLGGQIECSDGAVLHDWAISGHGVAWRSMWEVNADIEAGRLVPILDSFKAPDNAIYAVFAQRKQMPLRVRMFIDFLKAHLNGQP